MLEVFSETVLYNMYETDMRLYETDTLRLRLSMTGLNGWFEALHEYVLFPGNANTIVSLVYYSESCIGWFEALHEYVLFYGNANTIVSLVYYSESCIMFTFCVNN